MPVTFLFRLLQIGGYAFALGIVAAVGITCFLASVVGFWYFIRCIIWAFGLILGENVRWIGSRMDTFALNLRIKLSRWLRRGKRKGRKPRKTE